MCVVRNTTKQYAIQNPANKGDKKSRQTKHQSPREVRRAVDDGHRGMKLFDGRRVVRLGVQDEGISGIEQEDVVRRDIGDIVLVLLGAGNSEALIGRQS